MNALAAIVWVVCFVLPLLLCTLRSSYMDDEDEDEDTVLRSRADRSSVELKRRAKEENTIQ